MAAEEVENEWIGGEGDGRRAEIEGVGDPPGPGMPGAIDPVEDHLSLFGPSPGDPLDRDPLPVARHRHPHRLQSELVAPHPIEQSVNDAAVAGAGDAPPPHASLQRGELIE